MSEVWEGQALSPHEVLPHWSCSYTEGQSCLNLGPESL